MINRTDDEYIKQEEKENNEAESLLSLLFSKTAMTKDKIIKEVKAFYSDYGQDGVVTYQEAMKYMEKSNGTRSKRLLVLLSAVSAHFTELHFNHEMYFDKHLQDVVKEECKFLKVPISKKEVQTISNKKWGADEKNWRGRLKNDVTKVRNNIMNEIKKNILAKRKIKPLEKVINKKFDSFQKTIKNLLTTETVAIASQSKLHMAKVSGYNYYKWIIKPDACSNCMDISGVFPISAYSIGYTAPPIHPHCRCIIKFIKSQYDT